MPDHPQDVVNEPIQGDAGERRTALRSVLDADSMPVPDPDELHDELDAARGRPA